MSSNDKPSQPSSSHKRPYSSFGRPFRLQLSPVAASDFTAPASRGRCQSSPSCPRFEWCKGAKYCRDCWLRVYHKQELPDRQV